MRWPAASCSGWCPAPSTTSPACTPSTPWLPLTDKGTDVWNGLFFTPTDWSGLPHLATVQGAYVVVLLSAAAVAFHRRDVLS